MNVKQLALIAATAAVAAGLAGMSTSNAGAAVAEAKNSVAAATGIYRSAGQGDDAHAREASHTARTGPPIVQYNANVNAGWNLAPNKRAA